MTVLQQDVDTIFCTAYNSLTAYTQMKNPSKNRAVLQQFSPRSIVRMAWKHKGAILAGTVALSGVAAWVVLQLPNVYRAEAVVLVDSQKIPEKYVASTVQVTLQDSVNAISQKVLNINRLQGIIDEFHLYEDQRKLKTADELVEHVRKDLSITLERGLGGGHSGAIRIAFDGSSATVVAGVVARVTELFVQENVRTREQRAAGTSDFIELQLQQSKKRLEEQETNLSRYKVQWAGELPQQETALLGALNRLQAELQANEEAINRAQQNKTMLESTLRFAETSLATELRSLTRSAPVAPGARSETSQSFTISAPAATARHSDVLRAQLNSLRLRYYDDHPEVKRVKTELDQTLEQEVLLAAQNRRNDAESAKNSRTDAVAPPETQAPDTIAMTPQAAAELNRERERVASSRTQLQVLNNEINKRNDERQRIVKQIADYQVRVEKLPIREQQMSALTRDYETSKVNYRSLFDKKISAEMAEDMERSEQSERFTIADQARVPMKPVRPKRAMLFAAAALAALALAIGLALAFEIHKNAFLGEWELPAAIGVLGRIPNMSGAARDSAGMQSWIVVLAIVSAGAAGASSWFFNKGVS